MEKTGTLLEINDVLSSTVASNGSINLKLGNVRTASKGESYAQNAQVWLITGIASLPAAPNGSADCTQALAICYPDSKVVIGTRDTRFQGLISDIQPGDTYVYVAADNASAVIKMKASDNSITITTQGNISLTAPLTTASNGGSADFVALAGKVNSILSSVKATLQGGITASSGTAAFNVAYTDPTNSVAATTLKAQ